MFCKIGENLDREINSVDGASDNDSDDNIPLAQLRTVFELPTSETLTFDAFVHIDDVLVTREVLTDDMICQQLINENTSDNDEDDDRNIMQDEIITESEAQQCVDKCFVQRQTDSDQKLFNSLNILEEFISKIGRKKEKTVKK